MSPPRAGGSRAVGLVADDLTGATDSAVQFAAVGWDARLLLNVWVTEGDSSTSRPRVVAVTTHTRASSDDLAAERTLAAVAGLSAAGVDRLFLKIDSTVRGSLAGQVKGALDAWCVHHPDAVAVVCPAFPDHGRTVTGGEVLVDGLPVAATDAALDPVTPVLVSDLGRLIPGSRLVAIDELLSMPAALGGCVHVDAGSNDDLAILARAIDQIGARAIPVGSAGLAQAMATSWAPRGDFGRLPSSREPAQRILVAVSSLHRVAEAQIAALTKQFPDTMVDVDDSDHSRRNSPIRVISTPVERTGRASQAVAEDLAVRVRAELLGEGLLSDGRGRRHYNALVLVGGDGAHAVLDVLGAEQVHIIGNIASGTPYGTIVGGVADGLLVVTKSGGFGHPDALLEIVSRLRSASLWSSRVSVLPAASPALRDPTPP